MAVLYTSRDAAIAEPVTAARKAMCRLGSFQTAYAAHALLWTQFWGRFDIRLQPAGQPPRLNVPMLLRHGLTNDTAAAAQEPGPVE